MQQLGRVAFNLYQVYVARRLWRAALLDVLEARMEQLDPLWRLKSLGSLGQR